MALSKEEIDRLYTQFSVQRVEAMVAEAAAVEAQEKEDLLGVDVPEERDYASRTVQELTELLEARDLSKSGNKAELVARLEESDNKTD